jgi:hypothetical protein
MVLESENDEGRTNGYSGGTSTRVERERKRNKVRDEGKATENGLRSENATT